MKLLEQPPFDLPDGCRIFSIWICNGAGHRIYKVSGDLHSEPRHAIRKRAREKLHELATASPAGGPSASFYVQFTNEDSGFHQRRWRTVAARGEQDAVVSALHITSEGALKRYIRRFGRSLQAYVSSEQYRLNGRLAVVHGFSLNLGVTA